MSEIYYAGGTAVKDISAADLIEDLKQRGVNAGFIADRDELFDTIIPQLKEGDVLLLMGARDPGLEKFGKNIANRIKDFVSQNQVSNHLKNITE
jgi:UDP-N-acetylmuramate--alanine ligase